MKISTFALGLGLALSTVGAARAQQLELPRLSPSAKVTQTVGLTDISVDYSSPGLRGRKVWGTVVPYGEVWRAGANQATKIAFSKDVSIAGTAVPAGEYAIFIIPQKAPAAWTVIINKDAKQSGTATYKKEQDLLRLDVKPVAIAERERLAFSFPDFGSDSATLALDWEKVRLPLVIKLGTVEQAAAGIKNLEANPQMPLTQAARYHLEQTKDLDAALRLVDRSIAIQEDWFNDWTKAQVLAAKGDKKAALPLAQKADELGAKTPARYFFAAEVKKAIGEWGKK